MKRTHKFFLPYQVRWLKDQSPLKIIEKSRQIGMTFADAYDSVKKVIAKNARLDVWVSSRDEQQAKLYLEDCLKWVRFFNYHGETIHQEVIDGHEKTSAYVLKFKNGCRIYSLSSNPNALAGKRGHIKLDEFALHQDQRMLYRVAKPVTQWGGQLCIISTHRGATTLFNQLIRQIKEGGNPMAWSLHTVPLEKAVEEGLVEAINYKQGGELARRLLGRMNTASSPRPSPPEEERERTADGDFAAELTTPAAVAISLSSSGGEGRGEEANHQLSTINHQLSDQLPPDPELREAWVKSIRTACIDEEQWLQEYCCVPADEANAFITFEMLTNCEAPGLMLLSFEELMTYCETGILPKNKTEDDDENDHNTQHATRNTPALSSPATCPSSLVSSPVTRPSSLFLGLDVARKHDLCVFDVGEKIGDVVWDRMRIELRDASFSQIEAELYRLLRMRELKRACIDATGMGSQLAERARQKFGWKVEPITFTAPLKEELAFGLRSDFEDRRIRIVRDEKLAADLRSIKRQASSSGNIRFEGEAGDSHCDRFWAKALRQHAARYKPSVRASLG